MHIGHIRQSILCHLESNLGFRFLNSLGASEIFACNLAFRTLQCSRTTKYFIILWEKILNSFSPWNLLWFMRVDASLITLVSHQFKADHKLKHLMIFFFFFSLHRTLGGESGTQTVENMMQGQRLQHPLLYLTLLDAALFTVLG